MSEAFVYIWYDALNKMYYLGKHKGSPDDIYTHSSTIWESFTKDNIPEGVTRRILAYGTDEEMSDLETKLLKNRKERCWDRYYNVKWHTKAIGNLNDILSEEGIKLWKERLSLAHKGKPKPELSAKLKKFHASTTAEERKKLYGHAGEDAWNWKGGISLGDNLKKYEKDKYAQHKELGIKLLNEGYSYDDIKSMYPKARLPYSLLPQEEKDRKNASARDRYKNTRECYCRKDTCDYCFPLKQTPEERKQREAKTSKIRNEKDKLDPIKNAHKKEVSKIWEMNNKEKRLRQRREGYVKKGPADQSGKNNGFHGKKHSEESIKKMSESKKGHTPWNKGRGVSREELLLRKRQRYYKKKTETQGESTLEPFFKKRG